MFEEYLQDSSEFLIMARQLSRAREDKKARRYYRVSVFCEAGAIEAFANYIADSFAKAETLTPLEIAFLSDKVLTFEKGKQIQKVEFHKLDEKLRFLLNKFVPKFDFAGIPWFRFMELKDLRDSLLHPRETDDETSIPDYDKKVSEGLSAIIKIMTSLSKGIFGKPLRRRLIDLIPD